MTIDNPELEHGKNLYLCSTPKTSVNIGLTRIYNYAQSLSNHTTNLFN
jgi:hypothetical protein